MVAAALVSAHTPLTPAVLTVRRMNREAQELALPHAVHRIEDAAGLVARTDIPAGEVIRREPWLVDVAPAGGDVARARYFIPDGMRLVGVRVDSPGAVSSAEGLDVTLLVTPAGAQAMNLAKGAGGRVDLSLNPPSPQVVKLPPISSQEFTGLAREKGGESRCLQPLSWRCSGPRAAAGAPRSPSTWPTGWPPPGSGWRWWTWPSSAHSPCWSGPSPLWALELPPPARDFITGAHTWKVGMRS